MSDSILGDERRLNDILWVDIEGYNNECVHTTGVRPATLAEIAEVHPKCKTCKHILHESTNGYKWSWCAVSGMQGMNPITYYCGSHSELTK